jgi:inorganic pyrophosphatase
VLGPPLAGGRIVRGVVLGLMLMDDEKGVDSKVVLSEVGRDGHPLYALTESERRRIADFFNRYKRHEPGKFSRVPGWGTIQDGREHVRVTHAFFRDCRSRAGESCRIGGR